MGIPVGYIIAEHINWKKKKPDSLRRMIIQQTAFWIAAIAGGILMHDTHFQKRPMRWKLPRFGLASALIIAGFAGGERLAKLLYPKAPTPPTQPALPPIQTYPIQTYQPVAPSPLYPLVQNAPTMGPASQPVNGLINVRI